MKRKAARRGAAMVEFAVVSVVFSLLLFGIIEFGLIFWQKSMVTGAAKAGTRFAMVRGSQSGRATDTAAVSAFVRGKTQLSPITVTTTWPTTNNPGEFVTVKVAYKHRVASGLMSTVLPDSLTLSATSKVVITF